MFTFWFDEGCVVIGWNNISGNWYSRLLLPKMAGSEALSDRKESSKKKKLPNEFRFHLFERCSGGVLNLRFDSTVLESYYTLCSFPHSLSRFRIAVSYFALVCATWMIFFAIAGTEQWAVYVAGTATGLIVAIILFGITCSKVIFEKNFLILYIILALFFSLLFLLAFVPSTVGVSSAFNASLIVQFLLILYINIPLRLWQVILIGGPVSLIHITLSCTVCGVINARLICIYILLHCCTHMIGFVQHILSQVSPTLTFLCCVIFNSQNPILIWFINFISMHIFSNAFALRVLLQFFSLLSVRKFT